MSEEVVGGRYARYVLFVLVLVYVFNFIDRQILSILAEEIKADLGISDGDIGFLYGTAFAVFYAVFGIPLGKLADVWIRKKLIAIGLAFWSAMTALSGTAQNFVSLAACRFGVGIGEASASPAAFSMLSDYFPPRLRATALAIYSSGVYIGAGIGLFLGGLIVSEWREAFPDPTTAPFGIKPWQAAFFVVGLPGLLMAIWMATVREPPRGVSEGMLEPTPEPHPFRLALAELVAVLPPFTLWSVARLGRRALFVNLITAGVIAAGAWLLTRVVGNVTQWTALGIGIYATVSWVQSLAARDRPAFAMIFGSRALRWIGLGFPFIAFVTYGVGFWAPPYLLRAHGVDLVEAATFLGLTAALGGWIGVTMGGVVADRLRRRFVNGRLYVGIAVPFLSLPAGLLFLHTDALWVAYACNFVFSIFSPMWVGPAAGTINDLVMPRMRATTSAFYILLITFIGLALGPFCIGQLSDYFYATGQSDGDALRAAMTWGLAALGVALVLLVGGLRHLPADEASRLERARAAGEPVT